MYHLFTIFKIALWNAYHRKYQLLLAFLPSTLALLTAQGFILACPQLLEYLIATSIGQTGHLFISMIILAYGLSYGAGRIFSELTDYLMMRVMNDLHQRVRQTTLSKVLGNAEANSIASHLYAAWERADQAIGSILNALVFLLLPKAFTLIAIWAIVSLKYGSYVSLAGVIGGLSYALWLAYSFKKIEHAITIQNDAETFFKTDLISTFTASKQFNIFGFNKNIIKKTENLSARDLDANLYLVKWQSIWQAGNAAIIATTLIVMMIFGMLHDQFNVAATVALSYYVLLMFGPIDGVSEAIRALAVETKRAEYVLDIMRQSENQGSERAAHHIQQWTAIELQNVTVLSVDGMPLFKPINLLIAPGDKIVFHAKSGVGKSSLAEAIYFGSERMKGTILIHQDERKIHLAKFSHLSHYLTQDNIILDRSIMHNVSLSRVQTREYQHVLQRILKNSTLQERLEQEPDPGVDVKATLSGGQKRRISLARLLFQPKDILLLDEPFTGLDDEAQHEMMYLLNEEYENCTMLFFLHSVPHGLHFNAAIELTASHSSDETSRATQIEFRQNIG